MNIVSDSDIDSRGFPIGDKNVTSMGDVSFVGFYANNFFLCYHKVFSGKSPKMADSGSGKSPKMAKSGSGKSQNGRQILYGMDAAGIFIFNPSGFFLVREIADIKIKD